MDVRSAREGDGAVLATLLAAYLAEGFPGHVGTSADALERDVVSGAGGVRVLLAEAHAEPVGFVVWQPTYDLHWGKRGAQIADLYVLPAHRGLGVALGLVAAVCATARREGATYLHGMAFDRASAVGRFYERIAVAFDSAECHCAGRAFRRLADLDGRTPREIARGLPPKSWNYEP